MTVKEYQNMLVSKLRRIYPRIPVKAEWSAMRDDSSLYCPRLDVAVGPFAYGNKRFSDRYDHLMSMSNEFIRSMLDYHKYNVEKLSWDNSDVSFEILRSRNPNARCLLAIEIENKVSRKHLVGAAVNAAALGRIGIVIAWTPEKLKAMVRLRRYLNFLGSVGKNTFDTANLLILDPDQIMRALDV